MTKPYPRHAQKVYLLTRGCQDRKFFLRPSEERKNAMLYCIARAQLLFPVQIHGFVFMSNHIHFVITDPSGDEGAQFMGLLNSLVARYLNTVEHRTGCVWDGVADLNWCYLSDQYTSMDKVVYTLANPVTAGLVHKHNHWPGAISTVNMIRQGGIMTNMPKDFFSKKTPKHLWNLPLILKPLPESESKDEYCAQLERLLRRKEREEQKKMKEKGWQFMGAAAVEAAPIDRVPSTAREGFSMHPKVAGTEDAVNQWTKEYWWFVASHKKARLEVKSGNRDAVFPKGTYFIRVFWGFAANELGYKELVESQAMNSS